ncbi:MAG: hypothetical protein QOG15_362, partial [Solirubrobacteraceae bacterium]|nr:hypothetical protein [Solirubrobacteraceae bacterium]
MSSRFIREPADGDAIAARIKAAAATVSAPEHLRRRIDAQIEAARAPRAVRAPWRGFAAVALACVAAIAVAVVLPAGPSRSPAPSLADATAAALRAPTSTFTALDRRAATLGGSAVAGATFPNYEYSSYDLEAVGARRG